MSLIPTLIHDIRMARSRYLSRIAAVSPAEAAWKPAADSWSVTEVTEHLFWAEHNGLCGMWEALHGLRSGGLERRLDSPHRDMTIEQVIGLTWQAREKAPEGAAPRQGGPLPFWRDSLRALQGVLDEFGSALQPDELRLQAFPHPISGPLDFHQRLEFLRFHLDRHRLQVEHVLLCQADRREGS